MNYTVISYFTPTFEYPVHARRLRRELEALDLPHLVEERPCAGGYVENTRQKPVFIREALDRLDTPVFWVDVDASVWARPDAVDPGFDFMAVPTRLTNSGSSRTWHVCALFFGNTDAARALLDAWIAETEAGPYGDDSALERAIKGSGWNGRAGELPPTYAAWELDNGRRIGEWPPVILQRLSRHAAKRAYYKYEWRPGQQ